MAQGKHTFRPQFWEFYQAQLTLPSLPGVLHPPATTVIFFIDKDMDGVLIPSYDSVSFCMAQTINGRLRRYLIAGTINRPSGEVRVLFYIDEHCCVSPYLICGRTKRMVDCHQWWSHGRDGSHSQVDELSLNHMIVLRLLLNTRIHSIFYNDTAAFIATT